MEALSITNLVKVYSSGLRALNGINLQVEQGDFFALLGQNGAGKSTTIGIIASLVNKTQGKVKVLEYDLDTHPLEVKSHIGLVPQEFNFNLFENVIDIVINQAGYYGLSRKAAMQSAEFYLKKLGLWDKRNSISRSLSGGMKRRLMIARALVHEPPMLILDEPTAGLDIEMRRSTWEFLQETNKSGKTIILTTHYLEEAEHLCKGIAIIDKGNIQETTTIKNLIQKLQYESLLLDIKQDITTAPDITNCHTTMHDSHTIELSYCKKHGLNNVFKELASLGIDVISLRNKSNRLEELFMQTIKSEKAE